MVCATHWDIPGGSVGILLVANLLQDIHDQALCNSPVCFTACPSHITTLCALSLPFLSTTQASILWTIQIHYLCSNLLHHAPITHPALFVVETSSSMILQLRTSANWIYPIYIQMCTHDELEIIIINHYHQISNSHHAPDVMTLLMLPKQWHWNQWPSNWALHSTPLCIKLSSLYKPLCLLIV